MSFENEPKKISKGSKVIPSAETFRSVHKQVSKISPYP
jgi:hypothetical protein